MRRLFIATWQDISKIYTAKRRGLSYVHCGLSARRYLIRNDTEAESNLTPNRLTYLCWGFWNFVLKLLFVFTGYCYKRTLFKVNIFDYHFRFLISHPCFLTSIGSFKYCEYKHLLVSCKLFDEGFAGVDVPRDANRVENLVTVVVDLRMNIL